MCGLQTSHRYGNATMLEADFVFGIGNRWANRHTGSVDVYTKDKKFIHDGLILVVKARLAVRKR